QFPVAQAGFQFLRFLAQTVEKENKRNAVIGQFSQRKRSFLNARFRPEICQYNYKSQYQHKRIEPDAAGLFQQFLNKRDLLIYRIGIYADVLVFHFEILGLRPFTEYQLFRLKTIPFLTFTAKNATVFKAKSPA